MGANGDRHQATSYGAIQIIWIGVALAISEGCELAAHKAVHTGPGGEVLMRRGCWLMCQRNGFVTVTPP